MKKILTWPVGLVTSLVSLGVMCLLEILLGLVKGLIGKVPFLTEAIDFISEILDLGLTALVAFFGVVAIWGFGHSIIEKLRGEEIAFQKSPVFYCNLLFLFAFLVATVIIGIDFFTIVGDAVTAYTSGFKGLTKLLMFFNAIKETFSFVCNQNIIVYMIGSNSLVLTVANVFADRIIEGKVDVTAFAED